MHMFNFAKYCQHFSKVVLQIHIATNSKICFVFSWVCHNREDNQPQSEENLNF